LREISKDGSLLSDILIRTKAKEVALEQNVLDEKFKASSGWVDNFKSRAGIRRGVMAKGMDEAETPDASPDNGQPSADNISHNSLRTSRTGAEMDNGVESEDSPETTSLRLQTSWSHPTDNPTSILRQPQQGPGIPTLQNAELAADTLLAFIYAQGEDFITDAERNALQRVKNLLFQTGQSLSYQREY
jgi:Tc5 transposase DNA-binding domain